MIFVKYLNIKCLNYNLKNVRKLAKERVIF